MPTPFRITEDEYLLDGWACGANVLMKFRKEWTPEMRGAAVLTLEDFISRNYEFLKGTTSKMDLDNE